MSRPTLDVRPTLRPLPPDSCAFASSTPNSTTSPTREHRAPGRWRARSSSWATPRSTPPAPTSARMSSTASCSISPGRTRTRSSLWRGPKAGAGGPCRPPQRSGGRGARSPGRPRGRSDYLVGRRVDGGLLARSTRYAIERMQSRSSSPASPSTSPSPDFPTASSWSIAWGRARCGGALGAALGRLAFPPSGRSRDRPGTSPRPPSLALAQPLPDGDVQDRSARARAGTPSRWRGSPTARVCPPHWWP